MQIINSDQIYQFKKNIYNFYAQNKRNFAWREHINPYKVLVSEIMLQQTQTSRVISKFEQWLIKFPDFATLAQASNHEVLTAWQGLGYNRRGLAIAKIAQIIMHEYQGQLPNDPQTLQTFPAIGPNTAGSICAFAFNLPTIFIETNIRTVYTYTFFKGQTNIDDKQILPFIAQTIDKEQPREWYYALMDYGVFLKSQLPKINSASKHYTRQSKFIGSKRQIRGAIIKILTEQKIINYQTLIELINFQLPENKQSKEQVIEELIKEKIIIQKNEFLFL